MYISLDFRENWKDEIKKHERKRGRPNQFPHSLMIFLAFLHIALLPSRQIEGFLRKLSHHIPNLRAADYSTICKRIKKMDIHLPEQQLNDDVILALDAS